MRALLQRVSSAQVKVEGKVISKIGSGLLILLGIHKMDTKKDAHYLANKTSSLRIFPDDSEKMNKSVQDIKGEILVISQFTLYGNCKGGRRPDFIDAANGDVAEPLYREFISSLEKGLGIEVKEGKFGAMMEVELINSGPFTLLLESPSERDL